MKRRATETECVFYGLQFHLWKPALLLSGSTIVSSVCGWIWVTRILFALLAVLFTFSLGLCIYMALLSKQLERPIQEDAREYLRKRVEDDLTEVENEL